ncbi:cytochrome b/b6 [Piptocephalis cylindrospora]|uniref:Cytochrome b n=1 Tax=Piptocephalis cylindrospora TaxID=1907219 RepID=A0A4P9Y3T9_9FUNG|nr:cytochrome b/b6 [Piptocephalis cylindrospora]|eukprot:RKP13628.1 cytochrome b/b6 [Piptocephalis cylindrospora]
MRSFKSQPILSLCLIIQIITGVTLAMHYTSHVDLAFIRLYYGSYRKPRILLWSIGGFSVDNATLNRFFTALIVLHLISLHQHGSNNPVGITSNLDRIPFAPYYIFKDLIAIFLFYAPNYLGHPDNYVPANPLVTPPSIVPEWYFLPFYAILRSIPDKLLGVVAMFGAIVILLLLPILDTSRIRSKAFSPLNKFFFWIFVSNHAEEPFIFIGQICTLFYFAYFLILIPIIGYTFS